MTMKFLGLPCCLWCFPLKNENNCRGVRDLKQDDIASQHLQRPITRKDKEHREKQTNIARISNIVEVLVLVARLICFQKTYG